MDHRYQIILASPEMSLKGRLHEILRSSDISKTVKDISIDEAHCISQWGKDFRKEYGDMARLRSLFGWTSSVVALSATVTPETLAEIRKSLQLSADNTFLVNLGNARTNLTHSVQRIENLTDFSPLHSLLEPGPRGIEKTLIFVKTREEAHNAAISLRTAAPPELQNKIDFYHSLRETYTRKTVTAKLRKDEIKILFSTNGLALVCVLRILV
jgi:superfamily II DNA helicase RecQ